MRTRWIATASGLVFLGIAACSKVPSDYQPLPAASSPLPSASPSPTVPASPTPSPAPAPLPAPTPSPTPSALPTPSPAPTPLPGPTPSAQCTVFSKQASANQFWQDTGIDVRVGD